MWKIVWFHNINKIGIETSANQPICTNACSASNDSRTSGNVLILFAFIKTSIHSFCSIVSFSIGFSEQHIWKKAGGDTTYDVLQAWKDRKTLQQRFISNYIPFERLWSGQSSWNTFKYTMKSATIKTKIECEFCRPNPAEYNTKHLCLNQMKNVKNFQPTNYASVKMPTHSLSY